MDLLRLGERLELAAAGEAPVRVWPTNGFSHPSTRPYLAAFEAAAEAGEFGTARRVLSAAVAVLQSLVGRQLAEEERRRRSAGSLKRRTRVVCSFCGERGPTVGRSGAAICGSCALEAAELVSELGRTSEKRARRRTSG